MDFISSITELITAIAVLIDALVVPFEVWARYRRARSHNSNTQQPSPPSSVSTQSQPRQGGLLNQNVARRLFLLVNTALGLVWISNAVFYWSLPLFIFGNGIIISTSAFVLIRRIRGNQGVVGERFKWSLGVVCFFWLISLKPKQGGRGCCWDWERLKQGTGSLKDINYFFSKGDYDPYNYHLGYWVCLISYLTLIYIECW